VSLRLVNGWPLARSSSRSAAKSYASPLNAEGHPVADHRLVSGLEVEDRKPAVAEPGRTVEENPSASGPRCAMARAARRIPSASAGPGEIDFTADAAHLLPHGPGKRLLRPVQLLGHRYGRLSCDS